MSTASVSVVIPAFNAEHTICAAIDSVLAQSIPAHEIIVVDDGSRDHTAAMVARYGPAVELIQQPNRKTAIARNRAIEAASGDFIAFLDADDYWEPNKLEHQLGLFRRHPEIDVIAGQYFTQIPGSPRCEQVMRVPEWYDRPIRRDGSRAFKLGTTLWTGTVIVRSHLLATERFESGLEPAEDRDLWVRLVDDRNVYLSSEPLATAVLQPNGISRQCLDIDCNQMLKVVQRNQSMLGLRHTQCWRSYIYYRWAANESSVCAALKLLGQSLLHWPLPFHGTVNIESYGRVKRLARLLMSLRIEGTDDVSGCRSVSTSKRAA